MSIKQNSLKIYNREKSSSFWTEIIKWFKVYGNIKDSRGRILKTASYLTLIIIVISAYFSTTSNSNTIKVITSTMLNICTSVLAAALIEIFARMRVQLEQELVEKQFRALFSYQPGQTTVAIVLPKFPIFSLDKNNESYQLASHDDETIVSSEMRQFRAYKNILSWPSKDLKLFDNHFAALADVLVASHLITLFERLHLPVPKILFDDEALELVNKPNQYNISTYIAVGLFSNELTMWVNAQNDIDRYFKIEHVNTGNNHIKLANCKGNIILTDEKGWRKYEYCDNSEYSNHALLAKVPVNNNNTTVIIIGGMNSYSTRRIGEYIQKKWDDILTWRDEATRQEVNDLPFAGVFEVPAKDNEDVSPSGLRVRNVSTTLRHGL